MQILRSNIWQRVQKDVEYMCMWHYVAVNVYIAIFIAKCADRIPIGDNMSRLFWMNSSQEGESLQG